MAEKEAADRLPIDWDEVILKSKNVDASLTIVKRKFTQAIQLICAYEYAVIRAAQIND